MDCVIPIAQEVAANDIDIFEDGIWHLDPFRVMLLVNLAFDVEALIRFCGGDQLHDDLMG